MLTKEQIKILNNRVKGKWSLDRKTGLVNVNGDFNSNSNRERYERKWKNLQGIRFGYVTGNFYCYYNNLTSLEGAPTKVGGWFKCSHNKLTSLEGMPQRVGEFTSDFLEIQRSVVFNQKNLINFYLCKSNSNVIISNYKKTRSLIFPLLKKETLYKYIFIDF